ncbi:MAG: hypothetical protein KGV54_00490 [Oceanivirga sp.]|nr:hypothetical protein [Oceanivirga sp.]
MKKVIAISAMLISMLSVADATKDFNKANELFKNNKKSEAISVLKKIKAKKGEEKIMERVNFALYELSEKEADKIKYLKLASKNKKSNGEFAVKANRILGDYEKNLDKKLELYRELNARMSYTSLLDLERETVALYLLGRVEEAKKLDDYLAQKGTLNNNKRYYYDIIPVLYSNNKYNEATELVNRALKLDANDYEYNAGIYMILSKYYEDSKTYLGNAYDQLLLAKKNKNIYAKLFFLSAELGKVKEEEKYSKKLLADKVTYSELAVYLYNNDDKLINKSIYYAKQSVKNKEKQGTEILKQLNEIKSKAGNK